MKHTAATPAQPPSEHIRELEVAIATLRQHAREELDETISLETGGATPKEKSPFRVTPEDRKQVRLNGHAGPARSAKSGRAFVGGSG